MRTEILAENAVEGQCYLLELSESLVIKMQVHSISKIDTGRGEIVAGVTVIDERYPGSFSRIAGGTKFLEYDEEFYLQKKAALTEGRKKKVADVQEKAIVKKEKKVKEVAEKKIPRSLIIDRELAAAATQSVIPDWEMVAQKVIQETGTPEKDKSSVISQAKARYKWYTVDGKVNPQIGAVK